MPRAINTPVVLHVDIPATVDSPAFSATAMLDQAQRQYYATSIQMQHHSVHLTSARVTQTPIQKTMAPVLRTLLADANKDLLLQHPMLRKWATGKPQRAPRKALIENPDRASLEGAALVYQFAKLSGEAPVKATARAAGIERDVAHRWLKSARKLSLL